MDALEARFWAKVKKGAEDECWEWQAATNWQGYGQFWNPAKRTMGLAHRFSYELHNGSLNRPDFLYGAIHIIIRHSCDNIICVNPKHLVAGSQVDNMKDKNDRNRAPDYRGERNPNCRLTDQQIQEIRDNYKGKWGEKLRISEKYGISSGYVSKILAGQFRNA